MKYMGSKSRIAKHILPIILQDRKEHQYYVEPFCGGCNSIDKVTGNRIASDNNKYLIAMWKGLQQDLDRPRTISKDLYDSARSAYNGKYGTFFDFEIGWIGWMASFNGRFFDGGYSGKHNGRDYISEQIRNTEAQIPYIKDICFLSCDYSSLVLPSESIIYCDIPYKGTKQYSTSKHFNHNKFFNWCRYMSKNGHTIYVSEYNAPSDFDCVWEMEVTNSMNTTKTYNAVEKLFTLKTT